MCIHNSCMWVYGRTRRVCNVTIMIFHLIVTLLCSLTFDLIRSLVNLIRPLICLILLTHFPINSDRH